MNFYIFKIIFAYNICKNKKNLKTQNINKTIH